MHHNRLISYRFTCLLWVVVLFVVATPQLFAQSTLNIGRVILVHGALSSPEKLGLASNFVRQLTEDSAMPEAVWILCQIELETANPTTARDSCSLANPTVYDIVRVGDSLAWRQQPGKAILAYEVARDLFPNAALVYHRLGKAYDPGKQLAVEAFQEAIRLAESGDYTLTKQELADAHLQLARNYLWWEAFDLALEESEASIALVPIHNTHAYRVRARAYAYLGQAELAQDSLEEVVRLDDSFWPYLDWGDVCRITGDTALAAEKYWQGIRLADASSQALGYERLCQLYLDLGNAEVALETCRILATRFGEQSRHMLMLGDAYQLADDLDSARATYCSMLAADPQNDQALRQLRALNERGAR